jgi:hypothetical protein
MCDPALRRFVHAIKPKCSIDRLTAPDTFKGLGICDYYVFIGDRQQFNQSLPHTVLSTTHLDVSKSGLPQQILRKSGVSNQPD